MKIKDIDGGNTFDWNRASKEYAQFRDIYPEEFYQRIIGLGLCIKGQRVLDCYQKRKLRLLKQNIENS